MPRFDNEWFLNRVKEKRPNDYDEAFKIQREIDNIKREYAKNNGYKLVEIPYTMRTYKNIEDYLTPHLI